MLSYPLDHLPPFKFARLASYLSDGKLPGRRLGASLALGRNVVAVGKNSFVKTHPLQGKGLKPFLHAEIDVALKRRHFDDFQKLTLYVYREDEFGMPALAKPCPQCLGILASLGVKKVVYSIVEEPFFQEMKM